jgi:hypothetical protein
VAAWPLEICGAELGAKAALVPLTAISAPVSSGAACILPPRAIEEQATAKLKAAFESGQIGDLDGLTVKQLQTLSKQNGVSIARTKSDFIKLLDQVEPGKPRRPLGRRPEGEAQGTQDRAAAHQAGARRPSGRKAGRAQARPAAGRAVEEGSGARAG